MALVRSGVTLLTLCVSSLALAQPAPPPPAPEAPQDPYAADPVMNEQIAEQLVTRAQELLDAKIYLDAKQLAVEALVKSPKGAAADRARYIIKVVNQHLDIHEDPPPTPPSQVTPKPDQVDLTPMHDPTTFDPARDPPPVAPPAQPKDTGSERNRVTAATVHGAIYGGVLGATLGAIIKGHKPAAVSIPVGIAFAAGGGLLARMLVSRRSWDEAQVRTVGSLNLWGGVIGGFFGQAVTGAGDTSSPTARGVLVGATIGSTVGLIAGAALAKDHKLTRGDVALVDTFAGIGTIGGLTIGMVMQPAQPEAYAVNAILGAAGGVAVGVIAGPQTNTTQRRMLRVAGLAAAGGALPFLLYAGIHDSTTHSDERLVGFLSSAGLAGGAYLGFKLTVHMDAGLDVNSYDKPAASDDAPAAMIRRSSDGTWAAGGLALHPMVSPLATGRRTSGMGVTLLGGTFR